MFRSGVEETIYVQGLCEIVVDHPSVDVHEVGFVVVPNYAEPSPVATALLCIGFENNPGVENKLSELASGVVAMQFFRADELWSVDSQKPDPKLWHHYAETELARHMDSVAVTDLDYFREIVLWQRPLLKFIGTVWVESL